MGGKRKTNAKSAEPAVEEQSSGSEIQSLGSTSSITIPRSSPLKKIIIPVLVLAVLGTGGFFFTSTDLGKSILGNPPADEELVKEDNDPNAPAHLPAETSPELDNAMPKEASIPEGTPVPAPAPIMPIPVPQPVKAVETPVKKAAATKAKSKAAVASKSKKSKAVVSKSKAKSKKAVASKKAKAKKPAAQASIVPARH